MANVKISALPVGVATSSTPFPALVSGVTNQVTLAPIYTDLALKSSTGHTHASTDLVSGTIATARLGSGTASSTTFLRGDQTYGEPTRSAFFPGVTVTPLVQSSWGWVNQSGASVTQGDATVYLDSTAIGTGIHARTVTAPATPYTITTLLRPWYFSVAVNQQYAGVVHRELGGKLTIFYVSGGNQLQVTKFTNPTTFSANPVNSVLAASQNYHWLRFADNGADVSYSISLDGVNFLPIFSEARGTFFSTSGGPQEVGFFAANDAGTLRVSATFFSWVTT